MKVFKKLSILMALCIAAVLVLAACGPKGGGSAPAESKEAQTEEDTKKEAAPADEGYTPAALTNDTYTNEVINLKMQVPSTWTLYTKEQLAEEYNDGAAEPTIGESFYEAYAQKTGGGDNISIIVQNATGQKEIIKSMGIKKFTEQISSSIPEALEGAGATNIEYSLDEFSFPLDDYACIQSTCELAGTEIFQRQVIFLEGNYLYSITLTHFDEASSNEAIGFFSKLK